MTTASYAVALKATYGSNTMHDDDTLEALREQADETAREIAHEVAHEKAVEVATQASRRLYKELYQAAYDEAFEEEYVLAFQDAIGAAVEAANALAGLRAPAGTEERSTTSSLVCRHVLCRGRMP